MVVKVRSGTFVGSAASAWSFGEMMVVDRARMGVERRMDRRVVDADEETADGSSASLLMADVDVDVGLMGCDVLPTCHAKQHVGKRKNDARTAVVTIERIIDLQLAYRTRRLLCL